jgi:hypothetical protein
MSQIEVKLTELNSRKASELAKQTGRTPDQLVNDAFARFADVAAQDSDDEQEKFLAWREAARRVAGIWADRDDLPDFDDIRKSLDRDLWDKGEK